MTDPFKEARQAAKIINYARMYGASDIVASRGIDQYPIPDSVENEIQERNRQYKELSMSKNSKDAMSAKTYQIETIDEKTREWTPRMDSVSDTYLDSVGRRWVTGKFCVGYRITVK